MVIHLVSHRRACFYLIIFCFQLLNAQRDPIEDIVKKDTLEIFSLEHKSSLIPNDFKYKKGKLTFIFSKKDFLEELRLVTNLGSKDSKTDVFFYLDRKANKFLKKLIKTNKEVSFFDSNIFTNRPAVSSLDIEAILERLLNKQEVKIFFKEDPIREIYKIRVERIGDEYSSTSIEYWNGDIFIIDKIENMVIE